MGEGRVRVELDGPVATVWLDRPEVHNALNAVVLESLSSALTDLHARTTVNAVVLAAAGEKSFCAGADLDELAGLDADAATRVLRAGQRVMAEVASSRLPVIAAVNGLALGGGFELVLSCTFPVISQRASFGLPESGLGLIPGYGGTQRLPRVIGRPAAAHLMITHARLSAERAYEVGLTPVPPTAPEELLPTAYEIAQSIAGRGPGAVTSILRALQTTAATADDLDLETSLAGEVTASAEAAEGIAAFKERRPPSFPHRA